MTGRSFDSLPTVWFNGTMILDRRTAVIASCTLLALVACGGDDDSAGDGGSAAANDDAQTGDVAASDAGDGDATAEEPAPAADANDGGEEGSAAAEGSATAEGSAGGGDVAFDFGSGVARVTIGAETYEFDLQVGSSVCRDVFDAIQVSASDDSGDVSLDMWIPPTDWDTYADERYDPPNVSVQDDTINASWVADPSGVEFFPDFPPEAKVDSYDKDGQAATGTATFIDEYALMRGEAPELVQGTFEVACDE